MARIVGGKKARKGLVLFQRVFEKTERRNRGSTIQCADVDGSKPKGKRKCGNARHAGSGFIIDSVKRHLKVGFTQSIRREELHFPDGSARTIRKETPLKRRKSRMGGLLWLGGEGER